MPLFAQDRIPAATVNHLKAATVLIEAGAGPWEQSGTGFLIRRVGRTGYIVTNAHVVARGDTPISPIHVTFQSGTSTQERVPAAVVTVARIDDFAVLRVVAGRLPNPIPLDEKARPQETMPIVVAGFPFGQALGVGRASPAVTITRGAISSLRRDEYGNLVRIQLDGELNPGNSGGPVVDPRGNLVGMATAKVGGTNIGFAIPTWLMKRMTRGYVKSSSFDVDEAKDGRMVLNVSLELVDPFDEITRISMIVAAEERAGDWTSLGREGGYDRLRESREYALKKADAEATGRVILTSRQDEETFIFQEKYVYRGGETHYTEPAPLIITFRDPQDETDEPPETENLLDVECTPLTEEVVTKLPAPIEELVVAGSGRYLVCKLEELPGLVVYDLAQAQKAETIRLPSTSFLFAAGGSTLVIYFRENNILQSWDLHSFEKQRTKPNPLPGVICAMAMGHARGDRAFVRYASGTEALANAGNYLLDTATLKPVQKEGQDYLFPGRNSSYRDTVHLRSNRDLTGVAEWCTSHSPNGLGLYTWRGRAFEHHYNHKSAGCLVMGDDNRIYTSVGSVYSSDLTPLADLHGYALYPAVGASVVLGVAGDGKMTVFSPGTDTPLCPWGVFPDWPEDRQRHQRERLMLDRRAILVPQLGRCAFVPKQRDRLIVRPFDLRTILDETGIDYLVVTSTPPVRITPGRTWTYQVEAISSAENITFEVEFGPPDMEVSAEGLVKWDVPKETNPAGEKVVILVADAAGEQTYHSFTLASPKSGKSDTPRIRIPQ